MDKGSEKYRDFAVWLLADGKRQFNHFDRDGHYGLSLKEIERAYVAYNQAAAKAAMDARIGEIWYAAK